MSYLQRLVDRAAGRTGMPRSRTHPVFPPIAPRAPAVDDALGSQPTTVEPVTPTAVATQSSADRPPEADREDAPDDPARPSTMPDVEEARTPAPPPVDRNHGGPPEAADPLPTEVEAIPRTEIARSDAVVLPALHPTSPPPQVAAPSIEPPTVDVVVGARPSQEPSLAEAKRQEPSEIVLGITGEELVTARPGPTVNAPAALPRVAAAGTRNDRNVTRRGDSTEMSPAPIDVHIDTIEIVADTPAESPSPAPTSSVVGFGDYAAIRSYEWGD